MLEAVNVFLIGKKHIFTHFFAKVLVMRALEPIPTCFKVVFFYLLYKYPPKFGGF